MSIIENKVIGNTLLLTLNNSSKRNSMVKGFHDEFQKSIKIADEMESLNMFCATALNVRASGIYYLIIFDFL